MLVPTSHTGTRASSRMAAIASLTSAACSAVVRKFHSPLFRSEGWSSTATRKPSRAQRTRVRTRKLPWSWPMPAEVIARLPSPPAKMITLATGVPAGRTRRKDSVTPRRAGIVRTSSPSLPASGPAGTRSGVARRRSGTASRRRPRTRRPKRARMTDRMIGAVPGPGKVGRRVVQSGAREAAIMATIYDEVYRRARTDPEAFWAARAEDIHWEKRWDRVRDDSRPPFYRWFAGGVLNTCYNALDLHVDRGRGKQTALIYDSPVTGTVRAYTYFELRDEVARFAGALRGQGVEKGDRVIIYMPAVPEAVIAMLACARL